MEKSKFDVIDVYKLLRYRFVQFLHVTQEFRDELCHNRLFT